MGGTCRDECRAALAHSPPPLTDRGPGGSCLAFLCKTGLRAAPCSCPCWLGLSAVLVAISGCPRFAPTGPPPPAGGLGWREDKVPPLRTAGGRRVTSLPPDRSCDRPACVRGRQHGQFCWKGSASNTPCGSRSLDMWTHGDCLLMRWQSLRVK